MILPTSDYYFWPIGDVLIYPFCCSLFVHRYRCDTTIWCYRLACYRAPRCQRNSSAAIDCCAHMQSVDIFTHHVAGVQYDFDIIMHIICIQNAKNTRKFQRSQIHWFHNVFNMYCVVGISTNLFRHKQ